MTGFSVLKSFSIDKKCLTCVPFLKMKSKKSTGGVSQENLDTLLFNLIHGESIKNIYIYIIYVYILDRITY